MWAFYPNLSTHMRQVAKRWMTYPTSATKRRCQYTQDHFAKYFNKCLLKPDIRSPQYVGKWFLTPVVCDVLVEAIIYRPVIRLRLMKLFVQCKQKHPKELRKHDVVSCFMKNLYAKFLKQESSPVMTINLLRALQFRLDYGNIRGQTWACEVTCFAWFMVLVLALVWWYFLKLFVIFTL